MLVPLYSLASLLSLVAMTYAKCKAPSAHFGKWRLDLYGAEGCSSTGKTGHGSWQGGDWEIGECIPIPKTLGHGKIKSLTWAQDGYGVILYNEHGCDKNNAKKGTVGCSNLNWAKNVSQAGQGMRYFMIGKDVHCDDFIVWFKDKYGNYYEIKAFNRASAARQAIDRDSERNDAVSSLKAYDTPDSERLQVTQRHTRH
ncbi:hypothetical protein BJ138DRAFT_1105828 [Hygrophoropsis aurantiaca]|uniref:Uncharacterized protein n=1 Tax=Hygrophoropsis aurantiaca TaxID=72124 RepID=A0ACB7ZY68_9AGAM|nr:hypothetical protein BJ138DRAFT_1105828 [Hygrophoropsis aurantiaca]